MWFAALGTYQHAPWFVNFLVRLLHNSSPVLELLESNPFPDSPPKYIRSVLYDYRFTSPANNSLLTEVEMDIDKFLLGQKADTSPLFSQGRRGASIKHNSNWWNAQPSKEYLSLTLSKEVEAYLKHFGWSMKVKKLRFGTTTTSTWEGWIVNRLFPLWAPYVPLFVAFCVAIALMPACLFGRLFCNWKQERKIVCVTCWLTPLLFLQLHVLSLFFVLLSASRKKVATNIMMLFILRTVLELKCCLLLFVTS